MAVLRGFFTPCPGVARIFSRVLLSVRYVLRPGTARLSAWWNSGNRSVPARGRFRNHVGATPKPRLGDSGTPKSPLRRYPQRHSVGVTETTIENGTTVSWGRASRGRPPRPEGRGWPRPASDRRFLHLRCALGGTQGRHGVDGASDLHARHPARPAHPALRARGGVDRDHAVDEGARHHPRQGRADLLHQPADGGGERGPADQRGPAPQGPRPPGRHQPRDERRRLPAAARGARAAVGHAHRHQHRDRRASRRPAASG